MPLSDEGARVPDRLEQLSQRDLAVGQLQLVHGREQFAIGGARAVVAICVTNVRPLTRAELELGTDPVGDAKSGRRPSGHQGGPRGRTDRTRGVTIGKPHARGSQAVDVRRAVEVRALAAQIHPAQVVHQNHDHVRRGRSSREQAGKNSGDDGASDNQLHGGSTRDSRSETESTKPAAARRKRRPRTRPRQSNARSPRILATSGRLLDHVHRVGLQIVVRRGSSTRPDHSEDSPRLPRAGSEEHSGISSSQVTTATSHCPVLRPTILAP